MQPTCYNIIGDNVTYIKINEIIDFYKKDEALYRKLCNYYLNYEISSDKLEKCFNDIKNEIINHYLIKYEYKEYDSRAIQDRLINNLFCMCDITKKFKNKDNKVKVYPVKESIANKLKIYKEILINMVDYQIETRLSIDEIFNMYAQQYEDKINSFIEELKNKEFNLYYGHPYYIIERSKFIAECIKYIPNVSIDVKYLINEMLFFENKYMRDKKDNDRQENFDIDDEQFYKDYDAIELCYKELLIIEDTLAPIVINYWKEFLTKPAEHSETYKYLTHSFSNGMVEPNLMNKVCCSLSTNEIKNYMYSSSGLIYDIDVDSIETMCTTDVGSWVTTKEEFIARLCPSKWQLTKLEGDIIFYEDPINSKLIMPEIFEKICIEGSADLQHWTYSEFFLNKNAKVIGVFYTDGCENIDEVEAYARKIGLPLVYVEAKHREHNNNVIIGY